MVLLENERFCQWKLFGKYKGMSPSSAILEINLVYLTEFEVLLYIKKKPNKKTTKVSGEP
jgi:hypothetical protein